MTINEFTRQKKKKKKKGRRKQQQPKKGEFINRTSWTQRYIPISIKVATMHDPCFITRGVLL